MKLSATADRVNSNTPEELNERIQRATEASIEYHQNHPELIEQRLQELNEEWDIERALQTNASALILGGSVLGLFVNRLFLTVPLGVSAFLLQHALQGWCPPLRMLRQNGYRTAMEIEMERHALQSLRSNGKAGDAERPRGNGRKAKASEGSGQSAQKS
ncbi:hypothetical protein [Marinimicrobium sp. ABcell2]|uniref:hypothetical protein n=1 Tax=Marinimicrobium sp. ABcell2 TaxID=3069751 RepID=UPI0027B1A658|nr:hypothetical protein [Marinimicrobium sp. ABcell2]MDQ2076847.1 hypothetical protein [Marinimicrobium sp. ABcell2]